MTTLQDLSDMSEVSVQLEDDSARDASNDKSDRSDEDSEVEEFFSEDDDDDDDFTLDNHGRLSLLGKMRARMKLSELFDEEDLYAIDAEGRVAEQEKHSLRAKMEERLRILTKFDKFLDMGIHHRELNKYFVKKQLEMQQLADNADA